MSLRVSGGVTLSLPSNNNEARGILVERISQFITRIETLEARLDRPLLTHSELTPLSTTNPEARDLAAEILQLRGMARHLQTWINTLTPIGQLPPEILGMIFVHYQEMCRPDYGGWSDVDWLRVSYVSHHWRAVALDTPRLWSYISFTGIWRDDFLPKLQLERSRSELLTVHAYLETGASDMDTLEVVLSPPHISRIGALEVVADHDRMLKVLFHPAESLEYLSIRTRSNDAVPRELFSGRTPKLRQLHLATNSLSVWNSSLLRSEILAHLSIHSPSRPSFTQLHSLLQELRTQLKSLHLNDVCSRPISEIPDGGVHPVEFTRLNHFMLTDTFPAISPCLQHVIKIPSSSRLTITIRQSSDESTSRKEYSARDIFEAISIYHSPEAMVCKFIVLNVNCFSSQHRSIQGWAEPPHKVHQIHSDQNSLPSIDVGVQGYISGLESFPLSCADPDGIGLSLSRVETMILRSPRSSSVLSFAFWNNVARLPNLSTIRAVRCHVDGFINSLADDSNAITILKRREAGGDSALGRAQRAAAAVHQVQRRFAPLKTLIFDSVNDFEEDFLDVSSAALFHILKENIRFRKDIGSPFESLQFVNCLLSVERRRALARLGATFPSK